MGVVGWGVWDAGATLYFLFLFKCFVLLKSEKKTLEKKFLGPKSVAFSKNLCNNMKVNVLVCYTLKFKV